MEKLIKLLNERIEESGSSDERISHDDDCIWLHWRHGELSQHYSASVICSKHFGFIRWLVYNNKIDLEEYKNESGLYTLKVIYGTDHYIDLLTNKVNSDFLLMLLSRQENQIEFLVSILK